MLWQCCAYVPVRQPLGHVRKALCSGWPGLGKRPEVPSKKGVSHLQMLKQQLKQRCFPSQLHRLTACFQAFVLRWVNCPLGADAHTDFTLMFSSRLGKELISLVSYYSFNAWQLFVSFRWMMCTYIHWNTSKFSIHRFCSCAAGNDHTWTSMNSCTITRSASVTKQRQSIAITT